MKLSRLTIAGCAAAMSLLPVATLAAPAETTATPLLQDLRAVAADTSEQAAELTKIQANRYLDLSAHTEALDALKEDINRMGSELARLEKVRGSATIPEQKAIDDAAPMLASIARNTSAAIAYVNANQEGLWRPAYHTYVTNIATVSSKLSTTLGEFEQYSKALGKEQHLEKALGLQAGSM